MECALDLVIHSIIKQICSMCYTPGNFKLRLPFLAVNRQFRQAFCRCSIAYYSITYLKETVGQ